MARKKIVFIIVEGMSDKAALENFFTQLYDKSTVFIKVRHGDITSDDNVPLSEVINKTTDLVKKYANEAHLKNSNFQQIIHLIDTDGTYIPDKCIIKDETHENPFYTHESILTKYPQKIILRNKAKKEKMNRLYQKETIWDIPYQCYYMSCNLDHVLHDKQNSSYNNRKEIEAEKMSDALKFAELYMDRPIECADFFMKSHFSVCDDFIKSWRFIQEGIHSLERYTNLGIALKEIISANIL